MKTTKMKLIRLEKNIKQKDAAVACGVAPGHLSAVENGSRPLSMELRVALANYYQIPAQELL